MRHAALAGVAFGAIALASTAFAADMPVYKAPPPVALPPGWGGLYVGVQGGYGWGTTRQTEIIFDTLNYRARGGLAGVTWGYNYQANNIVVGFESDIAYARIRGSTSGANAIDGPCGGAPPECSAKLEWLGTNRLRVGAAWGNVMPFVTGGLAWGTIHGAEGSLPIVITQGSGSETRYGWTAGGGIEAKIGGNWSAKVEYLYVDLRNGRVFLDNFGGGFVSGESVRFASHIVRAGLNYNLGPGLSVFPMLAVAPAPYRWTGLYIGGTYGGGFGDARQTDPVLGFDSARYNVSGAVAGGTAGFNWQTNAVVLGLEADGSYSAVKGQTDGRPAPCFLNPETCAAELRWFGTARARAGLAWDRFLPYATGGIAWGSLHAYEGNLPVDGVGGAGTKTRVGWTAGGGVEVKINSQWSTKLEYLFVDFGKGRLFDDVFFDGSTSPQTVSFRTHIIRAGMNYSFNWERPIVTKD